MTIACQLHSFVGRCLSTFATTDTTSTTSSDKTNLATSRSTALDGRRMTNVLMVTTTVGMFNWIHSNTTNLGPAVALRLVLVISTSSFQHRLVGTSTTSDHSDHGSVARGDDLLGSGWETDSGTSGIGVVSDNGGVVSGGTSETSAVSSLLFQVANSGTFGQFTNRQNVSDLDLG